MAKFLFKVRYTGEGLQGVMKAGGSERRAVADDLAENAPPTGDELATLRHLEATKGQAS